MIDFKDEVLELQELELQEGEMNKNEIIGLLSPINWSTLSLNC